MSEIGLVFLLELRIHLGNGRCLEGFGNFTGWDHDAQRFDDARDLGRVGLCLLA